MRKLVLLAVLLALLLLPTGASAALGDLFIVSRADGPDGALGNLNSTLPLRTISADGRYVVIDSRAMNLTDPLPAGRNIFRRDRLLGRTELVSRATGVNGAPGDDNSFVASISADGQRVAFTSGADNLSNADDNAYNNIFVRDFTQGTTILASRASGAGGAAANGTSLSPLISSDGTVVAFQSQANNLDPTVTDNNVQVDAFVRDLKDDTTRLISKSTGNVLGNGLSTVADLSANGNKVVIETEADNLGGTITADTNTYVRDRAAGTTTLVSQPTGTSNAGANESAGAATIDDTGNLIVFESRASNLAGDAPPDRSQIYLRDLSAATTTLISRSATGAPGDSHSSTPVIAVNGKFVSFVSEADNLDGPASNSDQGFVRDLATGETLLVTRAGRDGAPAQSGVSLVSSGHSDRFIAFSTDANNLVPEAGSAVYQVFMRDAFVVDPPPAVTIAGKRFTAKLGKRKFRLKVTTSGGATKITARATIRVSKKIARRKKIVLKRISVNVPAARTSHTLTFRLTKKQNKLLLKALKTKRTRLRVSVALNATGAGPAGSATVAGRLRR